MDSNIKKIKNFIDENKITRIKVEGTLFSYLNDTREVDDINLPKELRKNDFMKYSKPNRDKQ